MAELCRMITHCNFGDYLDQALQDQLVYGIRHQGTQKTLWSKALSKATKITQAAETQASQFKEMSSMPVMVVKPQVHNQQYGVCIHCGGKTINPKTIATKKLYVINQDIRLECIDTG